VTWGGTIDAMSRLQTTGGPLGYAQRSIWNTVSERSRSPASRAGSAACTWRSRRSPLWSRWTSDSRSAKGSTHFVTTAVAASRFQAPSTDNRLVSIRKAITTLRASGYTPSALVLTPADSETSTSLSGDLGRHHRLRVRRRSVRGRVSG
jgi:hypothetical protein